ncbi:uncharacterized protein LOC108222273 isoform X2 [Daucus carota subsp. sativus]|uniref:uncharacterized protein LOC108222273 isoform X2 n=1 Tax=Daucus carota subsp. sativus TaxID=79200 RepID=UPI003082956E
MSVPILLRLQALRTQPLFPDGDGCPFWRLNCYPGESNILVQDSIVFGEKWITFDNEQEKVVEKHLSPGEIGKSSFSCYTFISDHCLVVALCMHCEFATTSSKFKV